jgi:hypothetical protein
MNVGKRPVYPFVFRRIDELGYKGWVGCEHKPLAATKAGLSWLRPYRAERAASTAISLTLEK